MAINPNYFKLILQNHLDCRGDFDTFRLEHSNLYSNLVTRKNQNPETSGKSVHDYFHYLLGHKAIGVLGETLTYKIQLYLTANCQLVESTKKVNIKTLPFYKDLKSVAKKNNVTVDELLATYKLTSKLEQPRTSKSLKASLSIYTTASNLLTALLSSPTSDLCSKIGYYIEENQSLNGLDKAMPEVFHVLQAITQFSVKDSVELPTNLDSVLYGRELFLNNRNIVDMTDGLFKNPSSIIYEALYMQFGYVSRNTLPPSYVFTLDRYLLAHKTLLNLSEEYDWLHKMLTTLAIGQGYTCLADYLQAEGYYLPKLTGEPTEFVPCEDDNHLVYINQEFPKYIIFDRFSYAYVLSNLDIEDIIVKEDKQSYIVFYQSSKGKKAKSAPFHFLLKGYEDAIFLDGNTLNVGNDNIISKSRGK